jgi:hypothetical protein
MPGGAWFLRVHQGVLYEPLELLTAASLPHSPHAARALELVRGSPDSIADDTEGQGVLLGRSRGLFLIAAFLDPAPPVGGGRDR